MSYNTTPTTSDLSILDPELRGIISLLPTTSEAATDPQTVVNYMRAIPAAPHDDPNIVKKDILISPPDALPEQPPTSVRIFIPKELDGKGPLPVVLWSPHGGMFSLGPAYLNSFCTAIALGAGVVMVAAAHRQTPEHPWPAPFDDVYQVLTWLSTPSSELLRYSIDHNRIAIGGTSAGATLTVGIFLKYRDSNKPLSKIRLAILEDGVFTDKSSSYSNYHNPVNKIWSSNVTKFMWSLYLGPGGSEALPDDKTRGYAVPALAKDLSGFPSTLVLTAQWDNLTNDGIAFAHRLLESGVPTEIHNYRGTFHVSDKLVHNAKISAKKRGDIIDALKAAFEDV